MKKKAEVARVSDLYTKKGMHDPLVVALQSAARNIAWHVGAGGHGSGGAIDVERSFALDALLSDYQRGNDAEALEEDRWRGLISTDVDDLVLIITKQNDVFGLKLSKGKKSAKAVIRALKQAIKMVEPAV